MLSWLSQISFKNNEIPHFNDSTFGIAPTLSDLFNYSKKLNIIADNIKLSDSGYRNIMAKNMKLWLIMGA